jgi:hypothetical protein
MVIVRKNRTILFIFCNFVAKLQHFPHSTKYFPHFFHLTAKESNSTPANVKVKVRVFVFVAQRLVIVRVKVKVKVKVRVRVNVFVAQRFVIVDVIVNG